MNQTALLARLTGASLLLGLSSSLLAGVPAQIPRGVFSLSTAGAKCQQSVLQNPNVDGISVRQNWSDLEPSENVYDFSYLESEIGRAAAVGKPVLLRINTQTHKPQWVTDAITKAGGTFVTFPDGKDGEPTCIPVFWDPTFLAKKKAMIAALGAHFRNNPTVQIVWSSFANSSSEDWNVPHSTIDIPIWQQAGYTSAKLLDAGKQIIDATMAAFPNQYVTLAVAGNGSGLDPDKNYVARNAIATAKASWPGRLIVQKNDLSTANPAPPGIGTLFEPIWDNRPAVAGQMLDSCYDDPTYRVNSGVAGNDADILQRSVNIGVSYGMKYIEIYQTDIVNLPAAAAYAHGVILGQIKPLDNSTAPKAPTGLSAKRASGH